MGEQGSHFASNHIVFVIMRNSRGKLFMYVALISILAFIVFLLSRTHKSLKELEGVSEKCQQQRDSLSAQLQVVYEHKNRLEKSLQQEKSDHRHSSEVNEKKLHEVENKLQQEKDKVQQLESQHTQLKTSYSELEEEKKQAETALKEQIKSTQLQKSAEIEKLQNQISDLLAEKDKLELANNAFSWKVEQHASDVNLCHLQLQQANGEHHSCQEQLQKYIQNTLEAALPRLTKETNLSTKGGLKTASESKSTKAEVKKENHHTVAALDNQTHAVSTREKANVLERPHLMPGNNNANDGVLPKPIDFKLEESHKALDSPLESKVSPKKEDTLNKPASNAIDVGPEKLSSVENNDVQGEKLFSAHNSNNNLQAVENMQGKEQDSHPQVQPPNNFDKAADHEDHGGEQGEFGNEIPQYPHDAKNQVEQPAFHDFQNKNFAERNKHFLPVPRQANSDNVAAQMHDMMNKSPGDINNPKEHVLNAPPDFGAMLDKKINQFRNSPFLNGRVDGHRGNEDKLYEEDDDDRENDDEPVNGAGQGLRGNMFQDNDFEDQENQDNMDNAKEEEGVVVNPK